MSPESTTAPEQTDIFDDEEEGWQDMPVVRDDDLGCDLDLEDKKKYHYVAPRGSTAENATGKVKNAEGHLSEWRSKLDGVNESEYTRLRGTEEDDTDEIHLRTHYLFNEDSAMTPLSQMQATKNMLTEAQRIAYVGLCALTSREMVQSLSSPRLKDLKDAAHSMELWALKIMGRLYYHMELQTQEQKMIESLALHGVQAMDLAPALMTTHTVANPEYDPAEARRQAYERSLPDSHSPQDPSPPTTPKAEPTLSSDNPANSQWPTSKVLPHSTQASMPGVTTSLSAADEKVTLDIRWTVLCDLFLVLIADSVYDARSRVLLENVALKLGLGWLDVAKFERRVTEALEIQEGVEKMENQELIDGRQKIARKKRYMMVGLATLGGGLVIGLSAGLLAPVIGAGLGAAFAAVGISGTGGFLIGAGGTAVITTGGVLTGSSIAASGMARRTRQVKTFDVLPLHNNKRVNCILTVPGLMTGMQDDVRLPFSVLDPVVGDVFSILWEPEMLRETGSALTILTSEVLSQIGLTVLSQTVMATLMTALQWPIILTKLGYLIDNPWNNALDRSRAAGGVLADLLIRRHLGVRPITLVGFSLGARMIFYALVELARNNAYGIVQDVFLLGATLTASTKTWCEVRSVVSGRLVNGYARNDWLLNYLFRATSAGLSTVAGLRPVENVPGLENVDVTDKIAGHMSYRPFMPLILRQLGFPVTADYFDEPVEDDLEEDRVVEKKEEKPKSGWFSRSKKKKPETEQTPEPPPPPPEAVQEQQNSSVASGPTKGADGGSVEDDEDLPPRLENVNMPPSLVTKLATGPSEAAESDPDLPAGAGFDLRAIRDAIDEADQGGKDIEVPMGSPLATALGRSDATPTETSTASGVMLLSQRPEVEARSQLAATGSGYYLQQYSPSGPSGQDGVKRSTSTNPDPHMWSYQDDFGNVAASPLTPKGEDGRVVVLGMESWESKASTNPWAS